MNCPRCPSRLSKQPGHKVTKVSIQAAIQPGHKVSIQAASQPGNESAAKKLLICFQSKLHRVLNEHTLIEWAHPELMPEGGCFGLGSCKSVDAAVEVLAQSLLPSGCSINTPM